jgi:hypothetical protein
LISVCEITKSLPEPGQVNSVAEEAQMCSFCPKGHESAAMHELLHCYDGGTWSCFFKTEVFFFQHFLLDVSALRDNTSDSVFASDISSEANMEAQSQNYGARRDGCCRAMTQ